MLWSIINSVVLCEHNGANVVVMLSGSLNICIMYLNICIMNICICIVFLLYYLFNGCCRRLRRKN